MSTELSRAIKGDLDWFHDCAVRSIDFDWGSTVTLRITVVCPADLGRPDWNGRTLVIVAKDVVLLDYELRMSSRHDSIDSIREGIYSTNLRADVRRYAAAGGPLDYPSLSISFSSGSSLEMFCEEPEIELLACSPPV